MSQLRVDALRARHVGPLSLTAAEGECVCLSGPSGAGKTLLLRAVADLDPHEGRLFVGGVACDTVSGPDWRRRVGMLPAESQWWHEQVGPHFRRPRESWLALLGFTPEVMDWQISRLSTGERQRLALLRLLDNAPEALLLDEPTASLDPVSVQRVEALIAGYRTERGAAVLWVSHDPQQIARVSRRHCVLRDGGLVELARISTA